MVLRVHCRILTSTLLMQTMKLTSGWGEIDQNHLSGLILASWGSDHHWNISRIVQDFSARKIQNSIDAQKVRKVWGHLDPNSSLEVNLPWKKKSITPTYRRHIYKTTSFTLIYTTNINVLIRFSTENRGSQSEKLWKGWEAARTL